MVTVRGTLSMEDRITNGLAEPVNIGQSRYFNAAVLDTAVAGSDAWAHGGFWRAAIAIYQELQERRLLVDVLPSPRGRAPEAAVKATADELAASVSQREVHTRTLTCTSIPTGYGKPWYCVWVVTTPAGDSQPYDRTPPHRHRTLPRRWRSIAAGGHSQGGVTAREWHHHRHCHCYSTTTACSRVLCCG